MNLEVNMGKKALGEGTLNALPNKSVRNDAAEINLKLMTKLKAFRLC